MKLSKLLITGLVLICSFNSNSQEYRHGLGLQYNLALFKDSYGFSGAGVPGAVYKGSLGFDISRDVHISISTYPFIGLFFNSQSGGYFGAELPLLCELGFGDLDDVHGFFGAGGTMAFVGASGGGAGAIVGPQFDLGMQFPFRDRLLSIKLAYTIGLNSRNPGAVDPLLLDKRSMYSLGIIYMFGN